NFSDITRLLADGQKALSAQGLAAPERVSRLVADFGFSSYQIDDPERGFSFRQAGPLDMRLNRSATRTAADVVHDYSERELVHVFRRGGAQDDAQSIARAIVQHRPFATTAELANCLANALQARHARRARKTGASLHTHPATVAFQALRIEVNDELRSIQQLLETLPHILAPGGRAAFISFHSLEDTLVTRALRAYERSATPRKLPVPGEVHGLGRLITRKAVGPSAAEANANPRSRSARLRVFERNNEKMHG
ncbi:MAG: 16S rRNA (cytosine(1402)-N(4))-methyltransferase RsmH, partial [Bdellovibrionales bacterium]|nr:16S rRNA (cytosine(1402)-N(4))-methyltransferase RsmH [Bdellovibrionales bacterium]